MYTYLRVFIYVNLYLIPIYVLYILYYVQNEVALFSKKVPKEFNNALSILDEAISKFPNSHAIPFKLAVFKTGISEYMKTSLSTQKSMGIGSSGLGGMRFQDMASLVLQMMLSIGILGDIIPNNYNDNALGNLLEVIQISGFKLLDLYFNLSRDKIDKTLHLPALSEACKGELKFGYIYTCIYTHIYVLIYIYMFIGTVYYMLLQHCFRQKLLGDHRKKDGIKWHMILHMPFYINYFGPSHLWDMVRYEKAHGGVKETFTNTSQRFGTANMEILRKRRIASVISSESKRFQLEETILNVEHVLTTNKKKLQYETETGISFESYNGTLHRHEIIYKHGKWTWRGNMCPFINPLLSKEALHQLISKYNTDEEYSEKKYDGTNT